MTMYQVNYQRRDVKSVTPEAIKGSFLFKARDLSEAIDMAIAELEARDDTASFVILDVREA